MSKKPTGITITRNGGKYTASWKCGDKNYKDGQQFQYKINKGSWVSVAVAKDTSNSKTRSKTISIDLAKYYPTTKKVFYTLSVRIRGKVDSSKSKWSDWATKTYTNYVPSVPSLSAELDATLTNRCKFTWNLTTETTDAKPYKNVRWETILVKECDVTDGKKLPWKSSTLGWGYGIASASSSHTTTEDTALLANASYTRWFRVCARGARGKSAWQYVKHVYARPYQAKINSVKVESTSAEGLLCFVNWTATQGQTAHPIDKTTVQYVITVPNENLTCPSGAQWEDANISADTKYTDSARFSIDNELDKDECLFVRVNTQHDSNITYGVATLAMVGKLKDPVDLTYQTNNNNHTLTSVSVDNESEVADSFIVIVYRAGSNPENEIAVGIIPHNASQPIVTPVQCPDWSDESSFSIGAYAAVGSYSANTDGLGYTVVAKMQSDSIWVGGAIPVAPQNVNAVQSLIAGTATVTWDWTWEEATHAQLSWTNHSDAWESTDEPDIYSISRSRATKWNIADLETGEKWYIAVRLVNGNPEDDTAIFGPWSDPTEIILSSTPNIPSLELSSAVITVGESFTASWDFVSNDGTGQISAQIKDENDNLIAHTGTQKEVVIDTEALGWGEGETHSLSVRVTSASNRTTDWSTPVSFVIAEALECSIAETSLVDQNIEVNPRSFSGDLITFETEMEEVFTKLSVDLEPIQSGSGTPSPSNVRPISGHDEVGVVRTGKNIFDESVLLQASGWTENNGVYSGNPGHLYNKFGLNPIPLKCAENTSYTLSVKFRSTNSLTTWIRFDYSDGTRNTVSSNSATETKLTLTSNPSKTVIGVSFSYSDTDTIYLSEFQVELGTTATAYEPYNGQTYTTTLPSTTYGGTLDLVSGVLTVTHGYADFGDLNWQYSSANTRFYVAISDKKPYASATEYADLICSAYKFNGAAGMGGAMEDFTIVNRASTNDNQILVKNTSYTDASTFKTAMTGQTICYELATPQTYQLTPQQIDTLLGANNVYCDCNMNIRIAEDFRSAKVLDEMPLSVTLSGVNDNITATLTIERAEDYHMDRPDETRFDGYEGEIVYLTSQNTNDEIIINQEDLIGLMDDEASYRVLVTFKDAYGQSMNDSVDFEVHWAHQAVVPDASVEIDSENLIAKLTPIAPNGTLAGDTCDIYRLSADRPELIVKNAEFGTQYVDPYPAIGEFGGHRFVFKTANGDYITEDNGIAWVDTGEEDGDILESEKAIIDFDGNQLLLYYNVDVGHQWDKDFQQTKYLGGSIQGDWNAGVSRSGSVSATMITITDAEQIKMMRALAVYTGICHVRTTDGSSYAADVQVAEDRDHDDYGKLASFSLTVTRVDTETLGGLTYAQWSEGEE